MGLGCEEAAAYYYRQRGIWAKSEQSLPAWEELEPEVREAWVSMVALLDIGAGWKLKCGERAADRAVLNFLIDAPDIYLMLCFRAEGMTVEVDPHFGWIGTTFPSHWGVRRTGR